MKAIERCAWCKNNPLLIRYHDQEWGLPLYDAKKLWELLILEGAQAGLSWLTVLSRRDHYRQAFDGFDAEKIAAYTPQKVATLLANPHIIRNRLKIASVINNARAVLTLQQHCDFSTYLWQFVDGTPITNHLAPDTPHPTRSEQSDALARDLKQRGFSFVGTTICYAFMQAAGMINDHTVNCFRYAEISGHDTRR